MLAYSTLAQVGFILVGIGWGTPLAIAAAIVFAFNHSLIKAGMLMLAGYVASRASVKSASFDVVTGVGRSIPAAGVLFFIGSLGLAGIPPTNGIGSLGLAGIPPTNGFISKMFLFRSGIDGAAFGSLAFIGVGSILTLLYTMRAFQRIWWQDPPEGAKAKPVGDLLVAPFISNSAT
jgi:multicomponent Na+:H+ antiporter subunit D